MDQITDLIIGEVDDHLVEIQQSVSTLSVSLGINEISRIEFTVVDPGFRMHDAGYFFLRRPVYYAGQSFEVSAVSISRAPRGADTAKIVARSQTIQIWKREKGAANFGAIAASTFVAQKAAEVGLDMFIQSTPVKSAIVRQQNENSDESTWDVIRRLASDNEFIVFEAAGILYFTSEEYLLANQTAIELKMDAEETDPFYMHSMSVRRSDNSFFGSTLQARVPRVNGMKIRPGMVVTLSGLNFMNRAHLVDRVTWKAGVPDPVTVSARTLDDSSDLGCELKVFGRGANGDCVKRLQQGVGVPADGAFGPVTEAAVKAFQVKKGLALITLIAPSGAAGFPLPTLIEPVGAVGPITWAAIMRTPAAAAAEAEAFNTAQKGHVLSGIVE